VLIRERTRSNKNKLKYRKIRLGIIRENFFIVWLNTQYRNSCPEWLWTLCP